MNFAPTETSKNNLLNEGKKENTIFVTGNTVIDAMDSTVKKDYKHEVLDWVGNDKMILITCHRRENLGQPMKNIFKGIKKLVDEFDDIKIVYPIHLNPLVRNTANEVFGNNDRIRLIEPLDVFDFHNFINNSYFIMTDSGGVQEEAPSLGKPVLVLRDTTERPEGVKAGTLKLAGTNEDKVYSLAKELLTNKKLYNKMSKANNPYGDGHASERIADIIEDYFKDGDN